MMIKTMVLCIWTVLSMSNEEHAIYVSVIEADIVEDRVEVEIKVFEDDLRDALRPTSDSLTVEENLVYYFNKHLTIGGNQGQASLIDHYQEGESYRILMNYNLNEGTNKIEVSASYFMELFPTQQNILKVSLREHKAYHIFKAPGDKYVFNFAR